MVDSITAKADAHDGPSPGSEVSVQRANHEGGKCAGLIRNRHPDPQKPRAHKNKNRAQVRLCPQPIWKSSVASSRSSAMLAVLSACERPKQCQTETSIADGIQTHERNDEDDRGRIPFKRKRQHRKRRPINTRQNEHRRSQGRDGEHRHQHLRHPDRERGSVRRRA